MALFRTEVEGAVRLARGDAASGPVELLSPDRTIGGLLSGDGVSLAEVASRTGGDPVPPEARVLAPIDDQDVWAAGVTYVRSRQARMEESEVPDHYANVYDAERPELFPKAAPGRVRGPGEPIAIRSESTWDVPEPELGLVVDARGRIVGYVLANDVSSRSIEGENPLYLPQAKVYDGSCAVGPCIVPIDEAPPLKEMRIGLRVLRDGQAIVDEEVDVGDLHRTPAELVSWLFRAMSFPRGAVLLTGTSIVPAPTFSLATGDDVEIALEGLGVLRNPVETVGPPPSRAPTGDRS